MRRLLYAGACVSLRMACMVGLVRHRSIDGLGGCLHVVKKARIQPTPQPQPQPQPQPYVAKLRQASATVSTQPLRDVQATTPCSAGA